MNKSLSINSSGWNEIIYYGFVLLISFLSFLTFSPIYHPEFNSDQAIHVLMSARNDYPQGIYYWGQNRLGSFLPEVTSVFVKIFHLHPLTAISIVNHLFLLTLFFILQMTLKNTLNKLFLAILIFFPLYTFNALLLIGHPYCSQLFVGVLALYFLSKSFEKIISEQNFKNGTVWIYGLISAYLFGISIWISESSILFVFFSLIYFLLEKDKRKSFFQVLRNNKSLGIPYLICQFLIGLFWILKIKQFKNYYPSNDLYDEIFISDNSQIIQQTKWMWNKFTDVIMFRLEENSIGWFTWICIIAIPILVSLEIRKKDPFTLAILLTLLLGFLALFFSTWNYRSEFEPRYFTILYPFLLLWIFLHLEKFDWKNNFLISIPGIVLVIATLTNNSNFLLDRKPGVVERFSGFADLPPGGMIGNYWQVYRACSISPFHLKGIAKEGDPLRNDHMLKEVMNEKIIYVIKTDFLDMEKPMPDTLVQYGYTLVKKNPKEKEIGFVSLGEYTISK